MLPDDVQRRADEYADWVRALRTEASPTPVPAADDGPLAHLGHELELLADALEARERELLRLLDVVSAVGNRLRLDDVLARVFAGFRGLIPYDRIGCALLEDNGAVLRARWAHSTLGRLRIDIGYAQPMAGSSLEAILNSGRPRIINDLAAYLRQKPSSDSTRRVVEEGGRSSLTCPLIVDGVPLGFLFFTSHEAGTYTHVHQLTFRQIATQVAAVIHRSHEYEALLSTNRALVDETRRLQVVATTDPLTGVLNRRALDACLGRLGAAEAAGAFGVIMCDIDHFKRINDTHGHGSGDTVLKAVAALLHAEVRGDDVLGRFGGEEFAVVVDKVTTLEALGRFAERLRSALRAQPLAGDLSLQVTASFGVAVAAQGDSGDDVLRKADDALYEAKRAGRDRVVAFRRDAAEADEGVPLAQ